MSAAGAAGFNGVVTANAGVVVDNITIDGTEIDLSSGDLTIDVAGDIILDAGGGDFKFQDDGTHILSIVNSSSDVIIKPIVDNKDIIFQQRDGNEVARVGNNGNFTVADDLVLSSDSAAITFGADGDQKLFHLNDTGLILQSTATGDDSFPIFSFQPAQTVIDDNDYLGGITWTAASESSGTDATTTAASIFARAEADFTSSANKTKLIFSTGSSGAASEEMVITHDGRVISDNTAFAWCNIGLDNVAAGNANPGGASNISTVSLQSTGVARFNYTNAAATASVGALTTHNTAGGTANYNNSTSSYIQFTYYHSNGSVENASGANMASFGGN